MTCFNILQPLSCSQLHRSPLNIDKISEMRTLTISRYLDFLIQLELYVCMWDCGLEQGMGIGFLVIRRKNKEDLQG